MTPQEDHSTAPSDAEILRSLVDRQGTGLRMLLDTHGGIVRGAIARSFYPRLQTDEIDDVMSTAAFLAWRNAPSFELERGTLRAWLFVIARNEALQTLRRKQQDAARRATDVDVVEIPRPGPLPDPDPKTGLDTEFLTTLQSCVCKLPRLQRAIIEADLRSGDVADAKELANQLGTTANTVYVSRNKARMALRKQLHELGYDPTGNEKYA